MWKTACLAFLDLSDRPWSNFESGRENKQMTHAHTSSVYTLCLWFLALLGFGLGVASDIPFRSMTVSSYTPTKGHYKSITQRNRLTHNNATYNVFEN